MADDTRMDPAAIPRPEGAGPSADAFDALQTSERQFRAAMEHSPIGMALTRIDGTWIDVNPALCSFLGYSRQELMEAGFKQVTHADDREATILMARNMVATHQKSITLEKRYIHADGSVLAGLLSLTVVRDPDDRPVMFISQIVDVTAARRLDHLKSEFITTVNHELRTPLTGIMGALALLEQFSLAGMGERDQKLIGVASKNAARLKSLLDDILEMESLRAGADGSAMHEVDAKDILNKVLNAVQGKAAAASIRLQADVGPDALLVSTDPEKLGRVLRILISNAIKYSDADGQVLIEAGPVSGNLRVTVTNQGRPIPETMRPFLFQPFVQGESTDVRRKQGSGLGLSIAKQLVDMLDGVIDFTSNDLATRFWVDLPGIRAPAAAL
jgi:PAS domain S-box-containing protein